MLKDGDLVFVGGRSLISKAIKVVSSGRLHHLKIVPSHVAIVSAMYGGKVVLVEANFRRVQYVDLDIYDDYDVWFARMKDPRDIHKGLQWANRQLGKRYDYTALVGILMRSMFRLLGPEVYNRVKFMRNMLESRTRFFCSELVSKYAKETGKALWRHADSVTTPFDLFRSDEITFVS
jgi:hypothetical protein